MIKKDLYHRRGLTLIEMSITIFIILLLTGIIFWILLTSKTIWTSSKSRSDLRLEAETIFIRISREVEKSSLNTCTLSYNYNGPIDTALSFASPVDQSGNFITDDSGKPVWQKYIIYYQPLNGALHRKEVYGRESPFTEEELRSQCEGGEEIASPSIKVNFLINIFIYIHDERFSDFIDDGHNFPPNMNIGIGFTQGSSNELRDSIISASNLDINEENYDLFMEYATDPSANSWLTLSVGFETGKVNNWDEKMEFSSSIRPLN